MSNAIDHNVAGETRSQARRRRARKQSRIGPKPKELTREEREEKKRADYLLFAQDFARAWLEMKRKELSPRLGANLPEDVVYEILTMSGHGNWRAGKFVFRLVKWEPRIQHLMLHVRRRRWGLFAGRAHAFGAMVN